MGAQRESGNGVGRVSVQRMGASAGLWFSGRPAGALQLRGPADAEPAGGGLFLVRGGDGGLTLAAAACISTAASVAGGAARAGDAGSGCRVGAKHAAHDRRGAGCVSTDWRWHVGDVPTIEGPVGADPNSGGGWTRASIALGVVVGGGVLLQGVNTYRTYFQEWAVTSEFYLAYHGEWADAAQVLNEQPAAADLVYLIPYRFDKHYGFEYLYHGRAPARVIRAVRPDLARKVESLLAEMEEVATVKVLDWNEEFVWSGQGDENLADLIGKFGRYAGSEEFPNFRLHTYTDIDLERSWTFYEYLEPLTVHYDGGIDLVGLALGQGEEQMSSHQLLELGQERSRWVALQWQTALGLETDYAISLRLYNSEGEKSYQDDHVLGNSAFARTRRWAVGEQVDTLFHL